MRTPELYRDSSGLVSAEAMCGKSRSGLKFPRVCVLRNGEFTVAGRIVRSTVAKAVRAEWREGTRQAYHR